MKLRLITESFVDGTGMRVWRVPLTQGKFALVDDRDYELVSKYNWSWVYSNHPQRQYARTTVNHNGKQHTLAMHRLILNAPDGLEVDHKNGNRLDNRRSNLRLCNHSENMRNRRAWKIKPDAGSTAKGVRRLKDGRYRAQISLGTFDTEREAAEAYDRAASVLFSEYSRLNSSSPDQGEVS